MPSVRVKTGDTRPFDGQLTANGRPVNLVGVTLVEFHIQSVANGNLLGGVATVMDAVNGMVRYVWQPADLALPGVFRCEFEVTFGDGTIETFPNGEYIDLVVVAAIPAA